MGRDVLLMVKALVAAERLRWTRSGQPSFRAGPSTSGRLSLSTLRVRARPYLRHVTTLFPAAVCATHPVTYVTPLLSLRRDQLGYFRSTAVIVRCGTEVVEPCIFHGDGRLQVWLGSP